jgi:uncharacterized membrane protein
MYDSVAVGEREVNKGQNGKQRGLLNPQACTSATTNPYRRVMIRRSHRMLCVCCLLFSSTTSNVNAVEALAMKRLNFVTAFFGLDLVCVRCER